MKCISLYLLLIFLFFPFNSLPAQSTGKLKDSTSRDSLIAYYAKQKDLIDIYMSIIGKNPMRRFNDMESVNRKLQLSAGPILEYTLATGFTGGLAASGVFLTSQEQNTRVSSILFAIKYTQKKQFLLPIQSSIWLPGNNYYLTGDWRYLNFPQDTYGFGGYTTLADGYTVTYKYIRAYETFYKRLNGNLYLGIGYQLDYHWDIAQLGVQPGRTTDYTKYGFSPSSVSSGVNLSLLYDTRKNPLNPEAGSVYANLSFVQNLTFLKSNTGWNSVLIDLRKYIRLPGNHVLALWSYNVLTISGNPPYLDLPGTGNDTYNNTGRGYVQGRFLGKKMVDLEAEFRFNISRNGLIGAVLFGNAESESELNNNKLEVISPAFGFGLRIKFNKFSNTNVCIDFGIGKGGSHGFFGNLGEDF
jgi:hypothetical protein